MVVDEPVEGHHVLEAERSRACAEVVLEWTAADHVGRDPGRLRMQHGERLEQDVGALPSHEVREECEPTRLMTLGAHGLHPLQPGTHGHDVGGRPVG